LIPFGRPAAQLAEKDSAYLMQVALPGFEGKDIEVTATPTEVIVHAATKKEKSTQDVNVLWTEFGSNDVYRRFEVANPIDVDRVTAMLERNPEDQRPRNREAHGSQRGN